MFIFHSCTAGQMSNCPSYLEIKLFSERKEALIRDLVIACPLHFHVHINSTDVNTRVSDHLELQLFDGRNRYHAILFAIEQITFLDSDFQDMKLSTSRSSAGIYYEGLLLYGGCLLAATFLILFACLSHSRRKHKVLELMTPSSRVALSIDKHAKSYEKFILKKKADDSRETKLLLFVLFCSFLFVRIFIILSLTYSFGYFTFCFYSQTDLTNVRKNVSALYEHITDYHESIPQTSHLISLDEDLHLIEEYAELQSRSLAQSLENIQSNLDSFRRSISQAMFDHLYQVEIKREKRQIEYKELVGAFLKHYRRVYHNATFINFDDHNIYAENLSKNPWFYWSWHLFVSRVRNGSFRDFLFYLEAHETEDVSMQDSSFWNR